MIIAPALVLAGCAGVDGPSHESLALARTNPVNYKVELLAYLRTFLNDPTGVRNAFVSEPALTRIDGVERYVSCVRFDARNTSGTYRGTRDHLAVFFGGKLEQFGELRPEARDERCRNAAFQPFPELERLSRR